MLTVKLLLYYFIFLTLILSGIIVHPLNSKRGWRSTDIVFPLFALEYYLISDSALPQPTAASLDLFFGFGANGLFLKEKEFYYPKFITSGALISGHLPCSI